MFRTSDYDSFSETRFYGLGVAKYGPNHWFFVDTTDVSAGAPKIGGSYRTKTECMADAERFASERGFVVSVPGYNSKSARLLRAVTSHSGNPPIKAVE